MPSSSVHSGYQRYLTDLPWGSRSLRIQWMVRKFLCRNPICGCPIFTAPLPDPVSTYARKTQRSVTVLRAIGVALDRQVGARLTGRLRLPTNPATLLRRVRAAPVHSTLTLQTLGVDEWAWRRDRRFGTMQRRAEVARQQRHAPTAHARGLGAPSRLLARGPVVCRLLPYLATPS